MQDDDRLFTVGATTDLRDLQPQHLNWLWPQRIPRGMLTLLIGDPGLGKSLLAADIAARVSAGLPWPDGPHPFRLLLKLLPATERGAPIQMDPQPDPSVAWTPSTEAPRVLPHAGGVVMASVEDDAAATVLPRLLAAGANPDLTAILEGAADRLPSPLYPEPPKVRPLRLPVHLPALAQAVRNISVPRLLILDPLSALLSPAAQSSSEALEETLAGLADLARAKDIAILAVGHLVKTRSHRTLYRVRGSLSLIARARAIQLVTADPDHPERRILSTLKSIHGSPAPPIAFSIAPTTNLPAIPLTIYPAEYATAPPPCIKWEPFDPAAKSVIPADLRDNAPETYSALSEACDWLSAYLAHGPRPSKELRRDTHDAGLAWRTVQRARRTLHVRPVKPDNESVWYWSPGCEADNQVRQVRGAQP